MDVCGTPKGRLPTLDLKVPPTPALTKIGFGTGVSVYHFHRSPKSGNVQSPWAIKKVNNSSDPCFAERIRREAKIMKTLDHPNIVGFRGVMKTEDQKYVLAMEQCSQSLGDLIESYHSLHLGPFKPELINSVILGVSKALDYLHNRNIIHGDVKSYNILIKGDFELIKLCDFGASIELREDGTVPFDEYTGTASWNAPETFESGPITTKCDIFSLGLTIWEMLALVPPHTDAESSEEDFSVLSDESYNSYNSSFDSKMGTRPSLPDVPLGPEYTTIIEIFNRCTEHDFNMRPTCKEILEILKKNNVE